MPVQRKQSDRLKICFLIGFDRSGSSMIARMLAHHPQINLLFHPFNSTEVTHTQWRYWEPEEKHNATARFLRKMTEGVLDKSYIKSDWFYNYSKTLEIQPDGLNLIKDTKFHFKIEWLRKNFPQIEVFGIWRNPRDILCSLLRNDFHRTWYSHLNIELLMSICSGIKRLRKYRQFLKAPIGQEEIMAIALAMRTEMLLVQTKKTNWLVYEKILAKPDVHLNSFTARFRLKPFQFGKFLQNDYNVAGKKFEKTGQWKTFFSASEKKKVNRIFQYIS
ncbi:MAG TPA: sulfotransferase [Chitinophagales bacterium]|nr:sulfotransferase [Chitinophagales bacterium]